MAGNTFGQLFKLTTFGESHGVAIGGVIDGCPPGILLDEKFIEKEMSRRKPSNSIASSKRCETDTIEFISGVYQQTTTGTPLAFMIRNADCKSNDYNNLKNVFRPSHADYTYSLKYGIRDYRGGGRSSARETAARVAAGAIAKLILHQYNIKITAFTSAIGDIKIKQHYTELNFKSIDTDPLYCPDKSSSLKMQQLISRIQKEKDSIGGIATCFVQNCPLGLGEPVFDKLQADLAKAMLSIPAAKGFEYGEGFYSSQLKGSENNDLFEKKNKKIILSTNHSGGIQGGISNGEDIYFNVAFKPIASIGKTQKTVDVDGNAISLSIKGRHDICAVPRAVPVVEAMTALVLTDHLLRYKTCK